MHPIAIDASGPRPDSVRGALARGVSAVVVTTRAQNPTGVFVTAERAAELRPVLEAHPHTVLVEDDHAAELADVPLSTLAGATSAWSFVRSLSKPYGPDLRIAAVAGDKATVARIEDRLRIESGWVSTVLQRLALSMWTDPGVAETVAAGAREYDRRRTDLRRLLDQRGIESAGDTGLNVWVPVPDESHATATLLDSGFAVAPGSRFRQLSPPGIRVTVSNLADADVPALVAAIERCFAPLSRAWAYHLTPPTRRVWRGAGCRPGASARPDSVSRRQVLRLVTVFSTVTGQLAHLTMSAFDTQVGDECARGPTSHLIRRSTTAAIGTGLTFRLAAWWRPTSYSLTAHGP